MLARAVGEIPRPESVPGGMGYEPKWDGFRAVVFRDGDEVEIGSRNERPLTRYFPEVVAAVREQLPARCVLDGEIVIATGDRLDFEALLQRIHPAASRVDRLAGQTPASYVTFDLLALGADSLLDVAFGERRAALKVALAGVRPPVHVTPMTRSYDVAADWFDRFEGAGLDGVIGKPLGSPYRPGERAMVKVKHARTADCVVAGFRWHVSGPVVGSLLLGLYDGAGQLQPVGVAASFPMARRRALVDELAPHLLPDAEGHPWAVSFQPGGQQPGGQQPGRQPGAVSRWNAGKDLSWQPLRPDLVAEVAYDHMQGNRFRHATQFQRWRPDRDPRSCGYAQLEEPVRFTLADVLR